jgi:hypothetical protein
MRFLIILVLSVFSSSTFAGQIIIESFEVQSLQKSMAENQLYLKVGPLNFKISNYDIGRPTTPFYKEGSYSKRFYQLKEKCFEVTVLSKLNIARKAPCFDKTEDLHLPGFEEFRSVKLKDLLEERAVGFRREIISKSYQLTAYTQTFSLFSLDQAVYGQVINQIAPKTNFFVKLSGQEEVSLSTKGLEVIQSYDLFVSNIGTNNERFKTTKNSIRPASGGIIFSNSQGQVLIYNPFMPKPFGDYSTELNSELPLILSNLEARSESGPVCFRDNYANPTSNDCLRLFFDVPSLTVSSRISITLIDFLNQKVSFL